MTDFLFDKNPTSNFNTCVKVPRGKIKYYKFISF